MLKLKLQYFGHWCEELTHLKRLWCWERLKAGGEGDDRGWDGWLALLTQWTWVWASSGSWRWTGKPCMLQSMGSQRVRHNWTDWYSKQNKEDIFMAITVLVSVTSVVVVTGVYNCVFQNSFCISFALSKHLICSWFLVWWGDPNLHSWRISVTNSPFWIGSI